jgi:hypothetical protein
MLFSTHPFGDDGSEYNFYTLYNDPATLKEIYLNIKKAAYNQGLTYIDVFDRFEKLIIAAGGTLEGGEGGLTYTTDGQHPNELCAELFAGYINLKLNL